MTENRTPPGSAQGVSTPTNGKTRTFIEQIAGSRAGMVWIAESSDMGGGFYTPSRYLSLAPDSAHYYCSSLMRIGATTRSIDNFEAAFVLVMDDVQPMVSINPKTRKSEAVLKSAVDEFCADSFGADASFIIQTSDAPIPSYHYGWRIKLERDYNRWAYFIDQMKRHPIFGPGFAKSDPVHLFRDPSGINPKPGKNNFQTKLIKPYKGFEWDLDELAAAFGIDMSPAVIMAWAKQKPTLQSDEYASPEALREIMKLIPNDDYFDDRGKWAAIGFALKNASQDDPDTRDLWIEWDNPTKNPDAARFWDTARDPKAGLSTLRIEIERRYGEHSPERELVSAIQAREAFPPLDEAEVKAAMVERASSKQAEQEKEIDKLLKEIAQHQPTPAKHRETDGAMLDNVFDLMQRTQVDAPIIFAPYLRGKLTVMAGRPGIGKSLLVAQQAMTIAMARPDLLRRGDERIQLAGDTLYFANEDGKSAFALRAAAWAKHFNVDPTKFKHKVLPVVSNLLRKDGDTIIIECIKLLRQVLVHVKAGGKIAMIVVDTVPTSVEGIEENSAKEMGYVHGFLKRLAAAFWAAVVLITHTTKVSWDGEDRSMGVIRGTGATPGAVRGFVLMSDLNAEEKKVYPAGAIIEWVVKSAAGRQGYGACAYALETVDIDVEDAEVDGKMVSKGQPVLVPVTARVMAFDDEMQLDSLRKVVDDALDRGEEVRVFAGNTRSKRPDGLHIRAGLDAKEVSDAFAKMRQRGWFSSIFVNNKSTRERYDRVLK